ncbi:MAG: hypothetical protein Q7S00_03085 [bacterium]|nr:hypothetical protein [bacterium]
MTKQQASMLCQKNHLTVEIQGEKKEKQYVVLGKKRQELGRGDKMGKAVEQVLNFRGSSKPNQKTNDGRQWFG